MKVLLHHRCAVLVLVIACLDGSAAAAPVGLPEDFESNMVGSFPVGWSDVANVDPASTTPKPSAVVVSTTNAFGNPTRALATLPGFAPSQGIYRSIAPSNSYSMSVDVRVDRFSDFDSNADPVACGCPPGAVVFDWPMQVGFSQLQGTLDPAKVPTVGLFVGAVSQSWRLFTGTANTFGEPDLGVPVVLGTWYGLQLDLDALAGTLHSRITDVATGSTLLDTVTSLSQFGAWDPAVDGQFNIESFLGGELSATTTSGLAVVDNINVPIPEPAAVMLLASALAFGAAVRRRR